MQSADEKDLRIQQLENENRKLQEKVKRLEHNVEALTQAILRASKQRFGVSSEKTPQIPGQTCLFGEEAINYVILPDAPVIMLAAELNGTKNCHLSRIQCHNKV